MIFPLILLDGFLSKILVIINAENCFSVFETKPYQKSDFQLCVEGNSQLLSFCILSLAIDSKPSRQFLNESSVKP